MSWLFQPLLAAAALSTGAGVSVDVTGVSATASVGNESVTGASITNVTGVIATTDTDSVIISISAQVFAEGISGITSVGDVTIQLPNTIINVEGTSSTASVGTVHIDIPSTKIIQDSFGIVQTSSNLFDFRSVAFPPGDIKEESFYIKLPVIIKATGTYIAPIETVGKMKLISSIRSDGDYLLSESISKISLILKSRILSSGSCQLTSGSMFRLLPVKLDSKAKFTTKNQRFIHSMVEMGIL